MIGLPTWRVVGWALSVLSLLGRPCPADPHSGLVGHWRLAGDCRDHSGQGNHGVNHGVDLTDVRSAKFDGIDDFIEVPAVDRLKLGTGDFSVALWVHTEAELADVLGNEKEVMGVAVYNGNLYAGTLPLGAVYRYDGPNRWTLTGQLDTTPNVTYRRVWSMAVYQGRLFAGTLPSGHVFSFEAGKCATCDRELAPGWRHVAALKAGGTLKLYVDGKCVATSTNFKPTDYNLANGAPLRIGFGQHDYFCGKIRDVRLYSRAISEEEIRTLAKE